MTASTLLLRQYASPSEPEADGSCTPADTPENPEQLGLDSCGD